MSRVRFATARDLYDSFEGVGALVAEPPSDEPSPAFVKRLAGDGKMVPAITFCAHLLPRREAVWWGCRSARSLAGAACEGPGLVAAEAWVEEPDDEHRQAALALAAAGDTREPSHWLAQAAGWSSGLLFAHPTRPLPVSPGMTAQAVRVAVTLAALRTDPRQREARLRGCLAEALAVAETGALNGLREPSPCRPRAPCPDARG